MKTRIRSKKLLGFGIAFATLAITWAMWGARPAKAIIIINSKTGLVTATQNVGFRVLALNLGGEVAIIDDGDVVDENGNSLMKISMTRLAPGHGAYIGDYKPQLADGARQLVRVEVRAEIGDLRKTTEPTLHIRLEGYDTSTGQTFIIDDGKSIIDDGK
ncbi:MAG TPA: hypothetical protein VLA93_00805 [Pyrinomonadaceae bacterium]|nr:hypothetical protein [Pyrinomonadaceae bacterium]